MDETNQNENSGEGRHRRRDDEDDHYKDHGAEAAGIVRGVARSVGRTVARSPIGSLPRKAFRPSTARQIAKVSDRISTAHDLYSAAEESASQATGAAKSHPWFRRAKTFALTLVKNSVLGSVVFETYCNVVTRVVSGREPDEVDDLLDEYARASVPLHLTAGLSAGVVQGVAVSSPAAWEAAKAYRTLGVATPTIHTPSYAARFVTFNTLNHSLAHSLLFGSYQGTKRLLEQTVLDPSAPSFGSGYLLCFTLAGGLAGQVQHVFSHYSEQIFGLSEAEMTVAPSIVLRGLTRPALRPTLLAFPGSAVGFVAFEYGKEFL